MTKATSNRLPPARQRELKALADLPDDQIDTIDIPEARDWAGAKRGLFLRPMKKRRHARARKTG